MKTNLDKLFKTDETLAKDGVSFVIQGKDEVNGVEEISFLVRHFNEDNPRVKAAMTKYYKPYARQIELGSLAQDKAADINRSIFIDVCLVSWEGVADESGKKIEFNKENAMALFKRLPALFDALWKHSHDFQNYKEDVGNS